MHGVTGRMGTNQHLIRSIKAIRNQGGVLLKNGSRVQVNVILSGRNAEKLNKLCQEHGFEKYTSNLNEVLAKPKYHIYFDSGSTELRAGNIKKTLKHGKHIYCEKPSAISLDAAKEIYKLAEAANIKHGVIQDKLFLPGLIKLKKAIDQGLLEKLLSVKIDFGYWVFTGKNPEQDCQRPSWNYRKEDGGGIISDMMCHWQYIINNLFGQPKDLVCQEKIHLPKRFDEQKNEYKTTAEDACYAMINLENDCIVQINSDWCTRVYRDDLVTFQVDGEKGSAVSTLSECYTQTIDQTPRPVWNPDEKQTHDFYKDWQKVDAEEKYDNGFKIQWELFIQHILEDGEWDFGLDKGYQAVEFAKAALDSWHNKKWINFND